MDHKDKPFHEQIADKLIKQLQEGTAPWQRPWKVGEHLPFNPTTQNRYRGVNNLILMSADYTDMRWMTYKQASDIGAQVRKGEKGTTIQYWKFNDEKISKDDAGKPILDSQNKPIKVNVKLDTPKVYYANVFNAEQIDGLPPPVIKVQDWVPSERAEQILQESGANIKHSESDNAFYRPSTDSIHLPSKSQFSEANQYFATALHELAHWTSHSSRLNRDIGTKFEKEKYAREEMRAEIASMILGNELGIGHDPSQHAAYVGSWVKVLKDDPKEILRASADAEKISAYLLSLEKQRDKNQEQDVNLKDLDKFFKEQQINLPEDRERVVEALKAKVAGFNPRNKGTEITEKPTKHKEKEIHERQR